MVDPANQNYKCSAPGSSEFTQVAERHVAYIRPGISKLSLLSGCADIPRDTLKRKKKRS